MNIKQTTNIETINSGINITEYFPDKILQNISSRLESPDLSSCKLLSKRFLGVVNETTKENFTSLSALKNHPMLSVDYYKSVTRSWLQTINMPATIISRP